MKKTTLLLAAAAAILLASCENPSGTTGGKDSTGGTSPQAFSAPAPPTDSNFIPVDSANKMIGSYLGSVSGDSTSLHSLILNANSLRDYLNSDSGKTITNMKVMFAHTLPYINAGNKDVSCGYKSGALTIVLAGYDSKGNYIYWPIRMVMDNAIPCPKLCPLVGQATSDLLP